MTDRSTRLAMALTVLAAASMLAGAAQAQASTAQETPAQARARAATSSLNGGPAESTLTTRANAQPPLSADERAQTVPIAPRSATARSPSQQTPVPSTTRPLPRPSSTTVPAAATRPAPGPTTARQATAPSATTDRTRSGQSDPAQAQSTSARTARTRPNQSLPPPPPLMEEPEPISLPLGYYVRGDKGCAQVWPREGDLAWLTPTAFTIDFGGCEPGQFLQTGPGAWRESQQCHTELGNDAGSYEVTYALTATGTLTRTAHLAIDGSVEEDVWRHCETADVPVEARFEG